MSDYSFRIVKKWVTKITFHQLDQTCGIAKQRWNEWSKKMLQSVDKRCMKLTFFGDQIS